MSNPIRSGLRATVESQTFPQVTTCTASSTRTAPFWLYGHSMLRRQKQPPASRCLYQAVPTLYRDSSRGFDSSGFAVDTLLCVRECVTGCNRTWSRTRGWRARPSGLKRGAAPPPTVAQSRGQVTFIGNNRRSLGLGKLTEQPGVHQHGGDAGYHPRGEYLSCRGRGSDARAAEGTEAAGAASFEPPPDGIEPGRHHQRRAGAYPEPEWRYPEEE